MTDSSDSSPLVEDDDEQEQAVALDSDTVDEIDASATTPDVAPLDVVLDGGDAALSIEEANLVATEFGTTVVLIAGGQSTGKTTMGVTIWSQFLEGPFADFRFAGSRTLDAFDQRHFASRVSSGNSHAETERTESEDMRVLHLRVASASQDVVDLMLSDIRGEFFEDLINGLPPTGGLLPLVRRADKVLVIVDGDRVAAAADRQTAIREARLLIGRLTDPGWMDSDTPLQVTLTKLDLIDSEATLAWYGDQETKLVRFAHDRGLVNVTAARISARPTPIGFEDLLVWIVAPAYRPELVRVATPQSGRVFLTGRFP